MKKIVDALNKAAFVLKDKPGTLELINDLMVIAETLPEDTKVPEDIENALKILDITYNLTVQELN
jgi:hypothetical protein